MRALGWDDCEPTGRPDIELVGAYRVAWVEEEGRVPRVGRSRSVSCFGLTVALSIAGCSTTVPTSDDGDQIPINVETVEVRLPFSEFGSEFQTLSGFGSPADLARRIVAHEWEGALESRALLRFGGLPDAISVRPPGGGTLVADSFYTLVGGRITLQFDTLSAVGSPRHDISIGAVSTQWHAKTANWELAVDTLGNTIAWPEPGGGPVRFVAAGQWDPFILADTIQIDTISLAIDSLTAVELGQEDRRDRGLLISGTTVGSRIEMLRADLVMTARPSIRSDTVIEVSAFTTESTFLYTPEATPTGELVLVGGVPASRAIFRMSVPETVDPPGSVCARIECPLRLDPAQLVFAGVSFHTRAPGSPAHLPIDTTFVQLRRVLEPDRLPRSPLGSPVHLFEPPLPPEYFRTETETRFELGITSFVRTLLADSLSAEERSPVLALVGSPEPASFDLASFYGPGGNLEPTLRLIMTLSGEIPLP
jgi:hypothetical protein